MTDTATLAGLLVEDFDPATLLLTAEQNIRTDPKADKAMIASVEAIGVRTPITLVRTDEGLLVRHGARRTLAAIAAGKTVPGIVLPDGASDEAARIIEQLAENTHREGLTAADTAAAVATLFDLKVPAKEIARVTGMSQAEAKAARTVAAHPEVAALVDEQPDLGFKQAATLAEFAHDEARTRRLLEVMEYSGADQIEHAAERFRQADAEQARFEAEVKRLTDAGVTVTDGEPNYSNRVDHWLNAEGEPFTNELEGTHQGCPGHIIYPHRFRPDQEWRYTAFCDDPIKRGHSPVPSHVSRSLGNEPKSAEAQTAERRKVRENNTAWRAAIVVRRKWLTELLSRQKPPPGALAFVLAEIGHGSGAVRDAITSHTMGRTLLGLPTEVDVKAVAEALAKASPQRQTVIALGLILGAHEAAIEDVQTWRKFDPEMTNSGYYWTAGKEPIRRYWRQIAEWGYPLSEFEQQCLNAPDHKPAYARGDEAETEPEQPAWTIDQATEAVAGLLTDDEQQRLIARWEATHPDWDGTPAETLAQFLGTVIDGEEIDDFMISHLSDVAGDDMTMMQGDLATAAIVAAVYSRPADQALADALTVDTVAAILARADADPADNGVDDELAEDPGLD